MPVSKKFMGHGKAIINNIVGATSLSELSDVNIDSGTLNDSQLLFYDSGEWKNSAGSAVYGGTVLYYNGSNWFPLVPGTDGTVLTTHGNGFAPTWTSKTDASAAVGGSNGMVQFNDAGTGFGGTGSLYWDTGNSTLTVSGQSAALILRSSNSLANTAGLEIYDYDDDRKVQFGYNTADNEGYIYFENSTNPGFPLKIYTSGTERMTIKGTGPIYMASGLHVSGTLTAGKSNLVSSDLVWQLKGGILVGTGVDTASVLNSSTRDDGDILVIDTAEAEGMKWQANTAGAVVSDNYMPVTSGGGGYASSYVNSPLAVKIPSVGTAFASGTMYASAVASGAAYDSSYAGGLTLVGHSDWTVTPLAVYTSGGTGQARVGALTNHPFYVDFYGNKSVVSRFRIENNKMTIGASGTNSLILSGALEIPGGITTADPANQAIWASGSNLYWDTVRLDTGAVGNTTSGATYAMAHYIGAKGVGSTSVSGSQVWSVSGQYITGDTLQLTGKIEEATDSTTYLNFGSPNAITAVGGGGTSAEFHAGAIGLIAQSAPPTHTNLGGQGGMLWVSGTYSAPGVMSYGLPYWIDTLGNVYNLTATGSSGGGTITGGGTDNYVTHWTAASNITGTKGFQYDDTTVTISGSTGPHLHIISGASNSVFLVSGNQVGIGTINPKALLHVSGNVILGSGAASHLDRVNIGDTTKGIYGYGNRLDFYISDNPRAHLDASSFYSTTSGGPKLDLSPGPAGTANYGFVDDTDTGMTRSAANTLHLLTAGVSGLTMDSSQNVGIGTTSPEELLDVRGSVIVSGSSKKVWLHQNTPLVLENTNSNNPYYIGNQGTNAASVAFMTGGHGNAYIKMILNGSGDVGIGTSAPSHKLDVRGDVLVSGALYLGIDGGTSPTTKIVTDTSSNGIVVSDNSGNLTQITAKGLILSENPTYDITNGGQIWMLNHASGTNTQTGYLAFQAIDNASNNQLYSEISGAISNDATTAESGFMDFNVYHTGSNETVMRMVSGNVGIGTITPLAAAKLTLSDSTSTYLNFKPQATHNNWTIGADAAGFVFYDETVGGYRMVIDDDGNVGIGTTSPEALLHVEGTDDFPIAIYSGTADTSYHYKTGGSGDISFQYHVAQGRSADIALISNDDGGEKTTIRQKVLDANNSYMLFRTRDAGALTNTMILSGANVGIGTIAPAEKLTVSDTGKILIDYNTTGPKSSTEMFHIVTSGSEASFAIEAQSAGSGIKNMALLPNLSQDIKNLGQYWDGGGGSYTDIYEWGWDGDATPANRKFQFKMSDEYPIHFIQDNNDRLVIASGGNIGIGTTSPEYLLDIVGDTAPEAYVMVRSREPRIYLSSSRSDEVWSMRADNDAPSSLYFKNETAGNYWMAVKESGTKVGMGTTGPTERLQVQGNLRTTGYIVLGSGANPPGIHRYDNSNFKFMTSSSAAAGLITNGAVFSSDTTPALTPEGGTLTLQEKTAGPTATADYGLFWVSGSAPNIPMFTDDAGTQWEIPINSPGSSEITGAGDTNYISYFTAASNITGTKGFQYDGTTFSVSGGGSTREVMIKPTNSVPGNDTFTSIFSSEGLMLGTTGDSYVDVWSTAGRYTRFRHAASSTTNGAMTYVTGAVADTEFFRIKPTGNHYDKDAYLYANHHVSLAAGEDVKLDANEGMTFWYDTEFNIYNDQGTAAQVTFREGTHAAMEFETDGDIQFKDNTTNLVKIASGGNVGIGTTNPSRKLHLSTAGTTFMKFTSDDTQDWSIGANSTAGFTIYDETDSLYRFCVKDGGKVGIGTTAPTKWLEVIGDNSLWPIILASGSSDHGTGIQFYNGASGDGDDVMKWSLVAGGSSNSAGPDNSLRFYNETDARFKMLLTSGGSLGIGTFNSTYPFTPSGMLHVRASGAASQMILETRSASENYSTGVSIAVGTARAIRFSEHGSNATYGGYSWEIGSADAGGTEIMRLTSQGNLGIGTDGPSKKLDVVGQMSLNDANNNVVIGTGAAASATDLNSSVIIGKNAVGNAVATADAGVFVGYNTGFNITSGVENVVLGAFAGDNSNYSKSVIIGHKAGEANTASYSVVVGWEAAPKLTSGERNVALGATSLGNLTTGSHNVALGYNALYDNVVGDNNTGVGNYALANITATGNTALGYQSGYATTTGEGNVFIGQNAGYDATATDSNKLFIANAAGTPLIGGDFSAATVTISGTLFATAKSFDIKHPTKRGKRLIHGSLEGPEHGVYVRGTMKGHDMTHVELPDYWSKLVGDDYTVQLTSYNSSNVYIVEKYDNGFAVNSNSLNYQFDYFVIGQRERIEVEINADTNK